jgi:hypothetical protein
MASMAGSVAAAGRSKPRMAATVGATHFIE